MSLKANDKELAVTERTRLKRVHQRGVFERKKIYEILDAMPLCHVGYVVDGRPFVTPTFQWREGDRVYWHGSSASRALRASKGAEVCLTVTLLDGMVLARSAFNHSANYRSVMIFGEAEKTEGDDAKTARLKTFVEQFFPGRWDELRPMHAQELKATTILSMPIEEASAKIRTGDPSDDEDDYALPIWAGVIPISLNAAAPTADPRNLEGVAMPEYLKKFRVG